MAYKVTLKAGTSTFNFSLLAKDLVEATFVALDIFPNYEILSVVPGTCHEA
jgi:hypothetical protein